MNPKEAKYEAEKNFKESGMASNLMKVIYHTKNFYKLKDSVKDFESRLNIGLTDINTEQSNLKVSFTDKKIVLTVSNYKGKKIKFGRESYSFSMGHDDDESRYEMVAFYIDDKLIVHAKYEEYDNYSHDGYIFRSLEELHKTKEFEQLILDMCDEIDQLKVKNQKLLNQEEEEKYKGKFSSEDD